MFKKASRVISFFVFCLLLPVMLIGCGGYDKKSMVEEKDNGILKIYMYSKETNEKNLKKIVEQIAKDKTKEDSSIVGIAISFYDADGEQYFVDTVPYAVGGWCTQTGVYDSVNQISTKNNKAYVEFSSKGDGTALTKDEKKQYESLLKDYKSDARISFSSAFLMKVMKDGKIDEIKDESSTLSKQTKIIQNGLLKYQKDGYEKILKGQL